MKKTTTALAAFGLLISAQAQAVPVDLSGWTAEGGSSSWNVLTPGNDAVHQTTNGDPTVFFDPTATSTQGTALNGKIKVTSTGDDDFIGFALGYNSGEITSSSSDFFLIDWKQNDQLWNGSWGNAGIAVSHVTDASNWWNDFWAHSGGVNEIQRGTNLGSTGWADNVEYDFNIVFTDSLIEVAVEGVTELSITPGDVAGVSSFGDGSFGFYNMSQANVLYSAVTQVNCDETPGAAECQTTGGTVPEPATVALMGLGLAGMGMGLRRRQRSAA